MDLSHLIKLAHGEEPADLLLNNVRVINVYSGQIETAGVAVAGGLIVGVGEGYRAKETHDLGGRYLGPGLLDAHVHIESAMVPPATFAGAVVPRGVTTVVTDPHEIANVMGLTGVRFMVADARSAPFTMYANASAGVPATGLATSGARLEAKDLAQLLDGPHVLGLSEVMNFPGVIGRDPSVMAKLKTFAGRVIDGHCPGLTGLDLNAYVAAGILSDHECTTVAEAEEKLAGGLTIFIREGTAAHNLEPLLPLITPANERRICWCTDDRSLTDLCTEGSIDNNIRMAVARGLDPVTAIRMATLNPAEYWRLYDRGAIAPGKRADLVVFADLKDFRAEEVYVAGKLVARRGEILTTPAPAGREESVEKGGPALSRSTSAYEKTMSAPSSRHGTPPVVPTDTAGIRRLPNTVRVDWARTRLDIPVAGSKVRVIGVIENQLITEDLILDAKVEHGLAVADVGRDILKMAVLERHEASGRAGLGLVRGMGLKQGALASTVAHDHHNLVVVGVDDQSMLTAARAVAETGGGLAVAVGEKVLSRMPLPIAGLMSEQPIPAVLQQLNAVGAAARQLGSTLAAPFMTLSFLALEVIPALKLTDRGLVEVKAMKIVPVGG